MATTTTERATTERAAPVTAVARRLRPSDLVLAIWVGFALITIVSGITGVVFEFHDDSIVSREVFGGIPSPLRLAFYVVTPLLIVVRGSAVLAASAQLRTRRARPSRDDEQEHRAPPAATSAPACTCRRCSATPPRASCTRASTSASSSCSASRRCSRSTTRCPRARSSSTAACIRASARSATPPGSCSSSASSGRSVRRYVQRPYRIRIKTKPEHAVILAMFFVLAVTGFATEMVRIALDGTTGVREVVVHRLPALGAGRTRHRPSTLDTWHQVLWCVHVAAFLVFLLVLPITMLRHMFTSPLNMYLRDRDRPKGAMRAMPNLTETELETFGAATVEDFTWKQLLDTDACTMCGRCTSVCPAHATGKPLDPREIVLKTGEVMAATGRPVGAAADRRRSRDHHLRRLAVRADHA